MYYKYKLNHLLSLMPAGVYAENVVTDLRATHGITPRVFNKDRFLNHDDAENIPEERLVVYASFFGVSVDELNNVTNRRPQPAVT